jgi:hypothetical protein
MANPVKVVANHIEHLWRNFALHVAIKDNETDKVQYNLGRR